MNFKLERFIDAHNDDYARALKEIQNGRKLTHWMWYIFPQITGLGMSETAQYYEIKSLEEARAYMDNEILGTHLIEITNALLELNTNNPIEIFGDIDSLKLKSSMTLFYYVSNNEIFSKVIDKYFSGFKDQTTIKICEGMEEMTKIITPVELSGYMQLHDKEIMLIASNVTVMPTNYLTKEAKYASKDYKVLFVYEEPKSEFSNMNTYLDNENINILYVANLTIEDMEHYINDNKPEYIYIDYFTSINTQQDFTNDNNKVIYLLDKLREYTEKYDVKFMIADRYNTKTDPKSIYLTDTYNNVKCVWVLKVDTMTRIK